MHQSADGSLDTMSAFGTKQTCSMPRRMSAFGGKADSDQPLLTTLDLCRAMPRTRLNRPVSGSDSDQEAQAVRQQIA